MISPHRLEDSPIPRSSAAGAALSRPRGRFEYQRKAAIMTNKPKHLTEEEKTVQEAAFEAFDVTPYVDRLAEISPSEITENEAGGVVVDMAKAWMEAPCPHSEVFYFEFKNLLNLILRLLKALEKRITTPDPIEGRRFTDPSPNGWENPRIYLASMCSVMMGFCWAWLASYRPVYGESAHLSPQEREGFLTIARAPEEEKQKNQRMAELEERCPYDPARVDEQKFADMLILDSLESTGSADTQDDDLKQVTRGAGLLLGKTIFEAYPECGSLEEYDLVIARVCDGVRCNLMREFTDSRLMRKNRFTPMILCERLQTWAGTGIKELYERGR